jgi:MinD superfamily P-loop ATPase
LRIAVTGGKGGTGKSTVAVALAFELAKKGGVLLVDADVDCPDDHLIASIPRARIRDVHKDVPVFDMGKCTRCGRCGEVCKMKAIIAVGGRDPMLVPEQCSGCGACGIACPSNAITFTRKKVGTVYGGERGGVRLLSGELEVGEIVSEFVVNALNAEAKRASAGRAHTIVDTAAGTHCSVISALRGSDIAFAVAEPTPLGEHDLRLILELLEKLGVPSKVVLNRSDIADSSVVRRIAEDFGTTVAAEIPFDRKVFEQYSRGEPVSHPAIAKLAEGLP